MKIDSDKYTEREMQISFVKLNLLSVLFFIVLTLIVGLFYYLIWGEIIPNPFTVLTAIGLLVGVVLHELIHGVVAAKYADLGWRSVSFGVMWKYLAPYCHCKEPLMLNHYRAVILMPSVVALIVLMVSISFAWGNILVVSTVLLVGGIGDFAIYYELRKEIPSSLVYDYPDRVGGVIFELKEE